MLELKDPEAHQDLQDLQARAELAAQAHQALQAHEALLATPGPLAPRALPAPRGTVTPPPVLAMVWEAQSLTMATNPEGERLILVQFSFG